MDPLTIIGVLISVLVIFIASILIYDWHGHQRLAHIPGPKGVPLMGNTGQIDPKQPFTSIMKWCDKFENVLRVEMPLGAGFVLVSGYENINEMLSKKELSGRPNAYRDWIINRQKGVFRGQPTQDTWKVERRICLSSFKTYGPGLDRIEHHATAIIEDFNHWFLDTKGEPVYTYPVVVQATLRMISLMIYGKKLDESDPTFKKIVDFTNSSSTQLMMSADGMLLDRMPLVRFLGNKTYKVVSHIREIGDQIWDWYKKESTIGGTSEDEMGTPLAQALLDYNERAKRGHGTVLEDDDIKNTALQMSFAGTFTTASTLHNFILCMVRHKDVQTKMRAEIRDKIGTRHASIADRSNMPYCMAAVFESLRLIPTSPIGLPHLALEDSSVGGYKIPKGTLIHYNVSSITMNKEYWGDPENFRPDRFLDEDGNLIPVDHPKRSRFIVFGKGLRSCPGEVFAHLRIFLWMVALVQNFCILPEDPNNLPPAFDIFECEQNGIMLLPKPFKARFRPVSEMD